MGTTRYYIKKVRPSIWVKIFGTGLITFGILFFLSSYPQAIALRFYLSHPQQNSLESPIPISQMISLSQPTENISFTDAQNWYPGIKGDIGKIKNVPQYFLSIPKLDIVDAQVSTRDYDLATHLVQYFGTSLPGQTGTAIVFGHSSLPQLFNSKNYRTIFSTLHTLNNGDKIQAKIGSSTFTYKIISMKVMPPDDTSIFSQSYDGSYLTLVTCFPPGTIWDRLVVRAKLETD